jgi:hypothetical protein
VPRFRPTPPRRTAWEYQFKLYRYRAIGAKASGGLKRKRSPQALSEFGPIAGFGTYLPLYNITAMKMIVPNFKTIGFFTGTIVFVGPVGSEPVVFSGCFRRNRESRSLNLIAKCSNRSRLSSLT